MPDRYHLGGDRSYRPASGRGGGASFWSAHKWLRTARRVAIIVLVAAAIIGFFVYRALKHVPEFYEKAMKVGRQDLEVANDKMLREVAGLVSDVKREGRWQVVFTAEQINGWLAVELARKRPDLLPSGLSDPRVSITKNGMTIAAKYHSAVVDTVVSLGVDVYRSESGGIALRVQRVRAGRLPLPLGRILDEVSRATNRLEWEVRWGQEDGDPVALISLPRPQDPREKIVEIDAIELDDGVIRLAGTSRHP